MTTADPAIGIDSIVAYLDRTPMDARLLERSLIPEAVRWIVWTQSKPAGKGAIPLM